MATGEESRFLILFLTGTLAFCLIAAGFILFYVRSTGKVYRHQLQLEKAKLDHQQELTRSVLNAEERERRRFARDLHDEAGALLAGIKLKLDLLQQQANRSEKAQKLSSEARDMLDKTIESVRGISRNLLPPSLETFGLFRCLEGSFREMNTLVETDFRYQTDRERLPAETELALYRVVSELCNNTLKHAGANRIIMRIQVSGNHLTAVYRDDGKGMNKSGISPGLGLKSMESRIAMLGGTIVVDPAPPKGMEARIELPL